MYADRIEDDPNDPDMVIAYSGYGTANQYATRIERKMLLVVEPSTAFVDLADA